MVQEIRTRRKNVRHVSFLCTSICTRFFYEFTEHVSGMLDWLTSISTNVSGWDSGSTWRGGWSTGAECSQPWTDSRVFPVHSTSDTYHIDNMTLILNTYHHTSHNFITKILSLNYTEFWLSTHHQETLICSNSSAVLESNRFWHSNRTLDDIESFSFFH